MPGRMGTEASREHLPRHFLWTQPLVKATAAFAAIPWASAFIIGLAHLPTSIA